MSYKLFKTLHVPGPDISGTGASLLFALAKTEHGKPAYVAYRGIVKLELKAKKPYEQERQHLGELVMLMGTKLRAEEAVHAFPGVFTIKEYVK